MANNPILFNAALSGVFGGINTSRSLTSPDPSSYAAQGANALAFATLLDSEIPAGSYTQSDADLLGTLVSQVVAGKSLAGLAVVTVDAIIAAFNAARVSLLPVGGGGGGTVAPLSLELWVDPGTTVALVDQNGSIATPFATLAQAVDAMVALKTATPFLAGTIHLADGDYQTEGLTWGVQGSDELTNTLILQGSGGAQTLGTISLAPLSSTPGEAVFLVINNVGTATANDGFDALTLDATGVASVFIDDSHFENIDGLGGNSESFIRVKDSTCNAVLNLESELTLVDTDVVGAVSAGALFLFNASIIGNAASLGEIDARESQIDGVVTGVNISLENCVLFSDITANSGLEIRQCKIATDGFPDITSPGILLQDSEVAANLAATGTIESDSKSLSYTQGLGAAVSAGTIFINDIVAAEGLTNWDAAAPLVLTVMPLPHAAGLYSIHVEAIVRNVGTAGTATAEVSANGIATGAISRFMSIVYNDGVNPPSLTDDLDLTDNTLGQLILDATVSSDATAAITVTLTPNGVTGSPLVAVFATARFIARSE